jgi:hypothetical protein
MLNDLAPSIEQNGRSITVVTPMVKAPNKPASKPAAVTPPFVPFGTFLRERDVISLGEDFDKIPSSDEKVSAVTAA